MKTTTTTTTTETQTKRITTRWLPEEETLLAECYVAVSEDNRVESDQKDESGLHQPNKDMLTGKWATLNDKCQNYNAIY
ncbi:hypothetical protein Tco_1399932 [Tanacetum coccineum]